MKGFENVVNFFSLPLCSLSTQYLSFKESDDSKMKL